MHALSFGAQDVHERKPLSSTSVTTFYFSSLAVLSPLAGSWRRVQANEASIRARCVLPSSSMKPDGTGRSSRSYLELEFFDLT